MSSDSNILAGTEEIAGSDGDASSYTVAVVGLPALLARNKYSRAFETDADDFAFKLLKLHHISPTAFVSLMERVIKELGDEESSYSFLSTHPITAERVKRARQAGMQKRQQYSAGTAFEDKGTYCSPTEVI